MKTVQDRNGNIIEVADATPCHAGKNGELPIMLDGVADKDIFDEMAAKEAAYLVEQSDYIANHKYKDDRKKLYGSIEEQLDMLYWDQVNGASTWKDHIDLIKLQHPKP